MITLQHIKSVYMIGIGGIGMSALARFFHERGIRVSGYDRTITELTRTLEQEGISIHYTDDVQLTDPQADWVVYTPAIPSTHSELNYYRDKGTTLLKRSEVLGEITRHMHSVCIAGTHGKTTISSLIAHILRSSQTGCNAFLGGISTNYQSNYWSNPNPLAVIEADEYDRSFLKLQPSIAVVSAMDPDHLDIYGTAQEMESCYLQFIAQVKDALIYKHGLKRSLEFKAPRLVSYSLQNDEADYHASNIQMHQGTYTFDVVGAGEFLGTMNLQMGGMHNIENVIAAIAVCHLLAVDPEKIRQAIATFSGVKRRFEYILKNEEQVYIDDYAHHPEELQTLINSARTLFKPHAVSVVFQPHLYTRTRDLADGFAAALDLADEVILLDIYPAREEPMPGVSSQMILDRMSLSNKQILQRDSVIAWAAAAKPKVLISAGAGDIDQLVEPLKQALLA